jgi:hypothetical protein
MLVLATIANASIQRMGEVIAASAPRGSMAILTSRTVFLDAEISMNVLITLLIHALEFVKIQSGVTNVLALKDKMSWLGVSVFQIRRFRSPKLG